MLLERFLDSAGDTLKQRYLTYLQNIDDMRNGRRTKVPVFDLETGARSGFKELEVSEDCGAVSNKYFCIVPQKFDCLESCYV